MHLSSLFRSQGGVLRGYRDWMLTHGHLAPTRCAGQRARARAHSSERSALEVTELAPRPRRLLRCERVPIQCRRMLTFVCLRMVENVNYN